jgi:hypothetical protein
LVLKCSTIKLHNALALALPIILYGSGIWTRKKKATDFNRDKISQNSQAHPFNHKGNEKILEELRVQPAGEKPRPSKSNWLRHVTRMNSNRVHKNVEL